MTGDSRKGSRFTEIPDAQVGGVQKFHVGVVEKSVHSAVVARRIVSFAGGADEGQKGRTRWSRDAGIRTARRPAVVPGNETDAGLCDEAVGLACRASGGVVHRISALPLGFDRTREYAAGVVGCAKKRREQALLKSSAGRAIRHLDWVIRRPPDFIWASGRRVIWGGAARNG